MRELDAALRYLGWGQTWFGFGASRVRDPPFTFRNIRVIRAIRGFLPFLLIWRQKTTMEAKDDHGFHGLKRILGATVNDPRRAGEQRATINDQ